MSSFFLDVAKSSNTESKKKKLISSTYFMYSIDNDKKQQTFYFLNKILTYINKLGSVNRGLKVKLTDDLTKTIHY